MLRVALRARPTNDGSALLVPLKVLECWKMRKWPKPKALPRRLEGYPELTKVLGRGNAVVLSD